jgi:hypothetical protein
LENWSLIGLLKNGVMRGWLGSAANAVASPAVPFQLCASPLIKSSD